MSRCLTTADIDIFNPYAGCILKLGSDYVLEKTDSLPNPFLQILGARWLVAQEHDSLTSRTIGNHDDLASNPIVTVDFFLNDLVGLLKRSDLIDKYPAPIFVFSDLPERRQIFGMSSAALNQFLSARCGPFSNDYSYESYSERGTAPMPIVPLGCAQSWLPRVDHHEKHIFLDEPHETLVEVLDNQDDVRAYLYIHAVKTCKILHDMGFKITSFYRNQSERMDNFFKEHAFIDKIEIKSWIPFKQLMSYYSESSMFYSFFTETHGYGIYENMQLGNGVITYSETFDNYRLRHMQGGPLLSIFNKPETCATIVQEYFTRYVSCRLRNEIRNRSREKYSAETFLDRLRKSHAFNNITF